jgi:enoyl-CoA hydratase/carnithine racemase
MEVSRLLQEIDAEISRLQQARALLSGGSVSARRGRKPGVAASVSSSAAATKSAKKRKKRNLSPEGRAAIQEAMRRRWEQHRKNNPK